jgi:chromate reductase
MAKIRIVGIAGSVRERSYNRWLLEAAREFLPDDVSFEIVRIDNLPFYDQDIDKPELLPEAVRRFREPIHAADGLLIATPEYNYSISGVLKNAIEWASRPVSDPPLRGKPVAIIGAATGMFGTVRAQLALRQIFAGTNNSVVNRPEVLVPLAESKFDAQGHLIDPATRSILGQSLDSFVQHLRASRPRQVSTAA